MRLLFPAVMLAVLAFVAPANPDDSKASAPDDLLFPIPSRDVAVGMFEKWQQEAAKKPTALRYTRVEFDRKAYWVVEASFGFGDPSEMIALYAPTTEGSFRRRLLAGPFKAGKLAIAVDAKTGILRLSEEIRTSTKGQVVLSCNLNLLNVAKIQKNADETTATGKAPAGAWIVFKFRGQKETSAGMAFPSTGRVPPMDVILAHGAYFRDLGEFREKMNKDRPEIKLFILGEMDFKSRGLDATIFQGFEDQFVNAK